MYISSIVHIPIIYTFYMCVCTYVYIIYTCLFNLWPLLITHLSRVFTVSFAFSYWNASVVVLLNDHVWNLCKTLYKA